MIKSNEDERAIKRMKPGGEIETAQDGAIDISYVEFYAGVGGWTMALEEALSRLAADSKGRKRRLRRIAALDHSDLCTKVFEHNFGSDTKSFKIERLTLKQVEQWKAVFWAMSPPCQPYTPQHTNQSEDLTNPRSASFLHLSGLLETMKEECLPSILVLENVIGFEKSSSFQRWKYVLSARRYHVGQFHLSPTQAGLPNDRPRYFAVAVQQAALVDSVQRPTLVSYLHHEDDLTSESIQITKAIHELDIREQDEVKLVSDFSPISSFLDDDCDDSLRVPGKVLKGNAAWCFDIVTPGDKRTSCFTHSYGRYIKGTGSVLYEENDSRFRLVPPEEREFQKDWASLLDPTKLRYFSGKEMSRLMGFRDDFSFPPGCSNKQQWKLIGNSLNVRLASRLLELGMRLTKLAEINEVSSA